MNSAYALFEITLTNAGPSPWLHLPLCVFMLACYLGVAYITHATQGFYSTYLSSPTSTRVTLRGHCTRLLHTLTPGTSLRPQRTRSWIRRRRARSSQDTSLGSASRRSSRSSSRAGSRSCVCASPEGAHGAARTRSTRGRRSTSGRTSNGRSRLPLPLYSGAFWRRLRQALADVRGRSALGQFRVSPRGGSTGSGWVAERQASRLPLGFLRNSSRGSRCYLCPCVTSVRYHSSSGGLFVLHARKVE